MKDISEKRAVELSWDKVRSIVLEEIKEILGLQIQRWEHHLITTDSLWLVGVTNLPC